MGVVKCCQLVKKVLLVVLAHQIYFFYKEVTRKFSWHDLIKRCWPLEPL